MLRNVPLFSGLSDSDHELLSGRATTRAYPKGTIVISEGDHSSSLYIVEAGKVRVFLIDEDGKEVTLNTHGPGEYFGELALLDDAPRSASVITMERSRLLTITKDDFLSCLKHNPTISFEIIRHLASIVRSLTENVKSLALLDVYGRVARALLNMAVEQQDGSLVINERLTHQAIANRVGASREMVGRIMKELTAGGYVRVEARKIIIERELPKRW